MSHCPSCGRYVGPCGDKACPYCGARLTGRVSIRAIKIAAILLATVGLAVLWLAATRAEVPLIAIGQAGATMNLAYVRLEGRCTRAPSYDPESDYLSFWIEDDTGEIHVVAYRAETQQIIEQGLVPAPGDLVEVAGTLRVREDFLSLTINVPDQLKITRAEPVERAIGAIAPEDQYLRVRVRGQVRQVYAPYDGLTLITIRDETGSIPVVVSEDLIAFSSVIPRSGVRAVAGATPQGRRPLRDDAPRHRGPYGTTPTLITGQPVEVVASVSLYGDAVQLVPASTADIVLLDQDMPIATERFIGELGTADVGQLAIVRGIVTEVNPFSAGVKLALDDGSGTITVLLWQDVYDGLRNGPDPGIGAEVQVQGEVSQYRGELEIVPELSEDVQVIVAVISVPDPEPIGELTTTDVGRWARLSGTLGRPELFSDVTKFTLDDGTGQIALLMWPHVYKSMPEGLGAGAQIVLLGQVTEYEGELALTGLIAGKMHVIKVGEAPQPTETVTRVTGDVTPADVGQTLKLAGTLGEPETFSKGIKFPLDDGAGSIILLLWQEVYDAIPHADQLVAGARVEVVGRIDEYRGELEIIPEADGVRGVE